MTHTSIQLLWHKTAAISKQLESLILCTSHMSWLNPHFCARLVLLSALTLEEQYEKGVLCTSGQQHKNLLSWRLCKVFEKPALVTDPSHPSAFCMFILLPRDRKCTPFHFSVVESCNAVNKSIQSSIALIYEAHFTLLALEILTWLLPNYHKESL